MLLPKNTTMTTNLPSNSVQGIDYLPEKVVALPIKEGYQLVKENSILYCKAQGNYTLIFFLDGGKLLISRKLKETSTKLKNDWFLRIHQSYFVNLAYAVQYLRSGGGQLVMIDGAKLPISRNKKPYLLKLFTYV